MTVITTRITVALDGSITGQTTAGQLPPGEHQVLVILATAITRPLKERPFTMEGFPIHDVPWDGSVSLHREDMYDGEGHLR